MGEVKPGDETSGLVEREWVRRSKRGGELEVGRSNHVRCPAWGGGGMGRTPWGQRPG